MKCKKLCKFSQLFMIAISLMLVISVVIPVNTSGDPDEDEGYTVRDPIRIDGNDDFAAQAAAEGWPGDGSEGDPYVIKGYEIDVSGCGHGIYVSNTTVYFSVRRCYIHNISGIEIDTHKRVPVEKRLSNSGFGLFNVQNFILENNIVSNTQWEGIFMYQVMDGLVNNNTVSNARNAIILSYSENVYVGNNVIENNLGITVSKSSNNNVVTKNSITGLNNSQGFGIGLSSSNNYINNNTISTYRYGISADAEHTNFIENNTFLNIGDEDIIMEYGPEENGNTGNGDTPFLGFAFFTIAILVAGSIWKQRKRI